MKGFKRVLFLIIVISLLVPVLAYGLPSVKTSSKTKMVESAQIKGVLINTAYNLDFPTRNDMSTKELKSDIEKIVAYVKYGGYNTIYFQAVAGGEGMYKSSKMPYSRFLNNKNKFIFAPDPLFLLTQAAKEEGIGVYAVIDPFYVSKEGEIVNDNSYAYQNPSHTIRRDGQVFLNPSHEEVSKYVTEIAHEIARKYEINGIIFSGLDNNALLSEPEYYTAINKTISMASDRIKTAGNKKIGISINKNNNTRTIAGQLSTTLAQNHILDFIMPYMFKSADFSAYEEELSDWIGLKEDIGVELVTINSASKMMRPTTDTHMYSNPFEMNYQYVINQKYYVGGFCIDSLSALTDKLSVVNLRLSGLLKNTTSPLPASYGISKELSINATSPAIITTGNRHYITGTSDPKRPLYINNIMVSNRTPLGVFGVDLELPKSYNRFIFKQGENQKIITISTNQPEETVKPSRITTIETDSLFPQKTQPVLDGEDIKLSCVAPGGATVTATLDGMSVNLVQTEKVVLSMPVLYEGVIKNTGKYKNVPVTDVGKVSYALSNRGKISVYRSDGNFVVFGEGHRPVVIVDDYFAGVTEESVDNGKFLITLPKGAKDYVVETKGDYYKLLSGGYIKRSSVEIDSQTTMADCAYSAYYSDSDEKSEVYVIKGTSSPPIKSELTENNLTLTFYNTTQLPEFVPATNRVFKDILKVKGENNTFQLHFVLNDSKDFWGYDISYTGVDGTDSVIYIKHKPKINLSTNKPLKGVSVMLDPGHGGADKGAQGAAGAGGPSESQLNLTLASTTKKVLEEMGATVQLTRYDDVQKTLFDRVRANSRMKADFFISIHHNSVLEGKNPENMRGVEVYYHYPQFKEFAENMAVNIAKGAGRKEIGGIQSYFLVTRMTSSPTALIEVGYIADPLEYEQLLEPMNVYRIATSIANSIVENLM